MPVVGNRFYNDPAIGAAFANIGQMFAPPSAQDSLALARAAAEQNDAARKMRVYDTIVQPGASNDVIDRQLLGSGQITPLQTFFTGAQANATTQRGQDIGSADSRYGVDVGARTSMSNNAADNVRALTDREMQEAAAMERLGITDETARRGQDVTAQTSITTNTADNTRAMAAANATVAGSLEQEKLKSVAGMYGPLSEGQVRPAMPADIATMFGAPGPIAQAEGRVALPSSDQVIGTAMLGMGREANQQFVRDKFAPNVGQVEGRAQQNLIDTGKLTPEMMIDTIMGKETPVQAVGPDGKPVFMTPGEATRTGAQPSVNTAGRSSKVENWISQDGSQGGIAVFDEARGQFIDSNTKQPLPPQSRTYTGQLVGGSEQTGFGKTTEAQDRNGYAATMSEKPAQRLLTAFDTPEMMPSTQDFVVFQAMSKLPAMAAPALVGQMSEAGQSFYQNIRSALPFQLMVQSGAAVTEQEYERKLLEITPVPGEAPAVTASKRENFATYLKAVRGLAGPAYDKIHSKGGIDTPALPGAQDIPVGTVQDGYTFRGGNPADPSSWEQAQ